MIMTKGYINESILFIISLHLNHAPVIYPAYLCAGANQVRGWSPI